MANLRADTISGTDGRNAITGSVEFDGTGDYLSLASNDFAFGTGDFTVEFFFYSNNVRGTGGAPGQQLGLLQTSDTSGGLKTTYTSGIIIIQGVNKSGTGVNGTLSANIIGTNVGSSTAVITTGSWNHLSLTRSSGTVRLFLNGILIDSETITGSIDGNNLAVGGYYDTSYLFNGFLSNFRIIKGTALYTSNFIPPTRKLIRLPGTVLLCCQDNTSVTTEATGKTITANGNPAARRFVPQVGSDGGLVFDGVTKVNTQNYFYLPTGITEQRFPNFAGVDAASARGVTGGAYNDGATNVLNYITISTTGNAIDFGDALTATTQTGQGCASSTRGVWSGGLTPTKNNAIQYVTISSTGNAQDFGDLTAITDRPAQCSNSTRGISVLGAAGPSPSTSNIIDYITIASTGNAVDFGDVNYSINYSEGTSCASSTRGIFVIGYTTPANAVNVIEYSTISTTGNAIDFGDLTVAASGGTSCSNSTRGLIGAFYLQYNTINYITIATTGNAQDFGDLIETKFFRASMASSTRAIFSGGRAGSNTLEYVTILTTGNSIDFGDLTTPMAYHAGFSNGHGGLG